ncbi:hypothetical protein [Limnobacter sp.]|uniref:hypothetical protein n=1 Tax=Limnobacter sp. TaxID=2003368 RepID=UPI002735118F|nr:hypothetical protein [Limnobacter sp.]MDP3273426.1 hypothetical protein [Limnobacter sp.]
MKPRTTQEMRERAQRQLDGMTVNRDALANDVVYLCGVVDRLTELVQKDRPKSANGPVDFSELFWPWAK